MSLSVTKGMIILIIRNNASCPIFFALLEGRQETEDGRGLDSSVFRIL